jgi:transcription factor SFP1
MHALVDHIEEIHIAPMQNVSATHFAYQASTNPVVSQSNGVNSLSGAVPTPLHALPTLQSSYFPQDSSLTRPLNPRTLPVAEPVATSPFQSGPFDPDDMELDSDPSMSSAASSLSSRSPHDSPSPPDTPISTPQSTCALAYPHALHPFPHYPSQPPSPHSHSHAGSRAITPEGGTIYPFNVYAGYSDYSSSMPGTVPSPTHDGVSVNSGVDETGNCVQPSVLFSSLTHATSPRTQPSTPAASRSASPSSRSSVVRRQSAISAPSTTLSRPASTLLLSKPFRCPKPNCNKSYKQANGLKYHVTHGSCSLKPVREVEAVKVLLASKSAASAQSSGSSPGSPTIPGTPTSSYDFEYAVDGVEVTQADLLLLEKRIRPFACGVGDCQRRYKNMNGLRYHYSHSGEHGRKGLEMLAMGVHECLGGGNGSKGRSHSRGGSRAQSRPQTPPSSGLSAPPTPLAGSTTTSAALNAGVYDGYDASVTLQAPQPPPPLSQRPSYSYQGMSFQSSSQSGGSSPFAPFQTTSYTLAGAMGPPGAGGPFGGLKDVKSIP